MRTCCSRCQPSRLPAEKWFEAEGAGWGARNNTVHRHPDSRKRLRTHITEVSGPGCLLGSSEMGKELIEVGGGQGQEFCTQVGAFLVGIFYPF